MLKLDLGGEMFWFLEYRTLAGFDGPGTPEAPTTAIEGMLIRLRVTNYILAEWDTFWVRPVINPGSPWFDP